MGVKSITRLSVEINFAVSFAIELEERSDSLLSSSEVNSFVEPSVILYKIRDWSFPITISLLNSAEGSLP